MQFDAFISYSHADLVFSSKLHRSLEQYKLTGQDGKSTKPVSRVFRDQDSLSGGVLDERIRHALRSSRKLIVLASYSAFQSEWVRKEIEFFLEHRDQTDIVVIWCDGAEWPGMEAVKSQLGLSAEYFVPNLSEFGYDGLLARTVAALIDQPLDAVLDRQQRQLKAEQSRARRLIAAGASLLILAFAGFVGTTTFFWGSLEARSELLSQFAMIEMDGNRPAAAGALALLSDRPLFGLGPESIDTDYVLAELAMTYKLPQFHTSGLVVARAIELDARNGDIIVNYDEKESERVSLSKRLKTEIAQHKRFDREGFERATRIELDVDRTESIDADKVFCSPESHGKQITGSQLKAILDIDHAETPLPRLYTDRTCEYVAVLTTHDGARIYRADDPQISTGAGSPALRNSTTQIYFNSEATAAITLGDVGMLSLVSLWSMEYSEAARLVDQSAFGTSQHRGVVAIGDEDGSVRFWHTFDNMSKTQFEFHPVGDPSAVLSIRFVGSLVFVLYESGDLTAFRIPESPQKTSISVSIAASEINPIWAVSAMNYLHSGTVVEIPQSKSTVKFELRTTSASSANELRVTETLVEETENDDGYSCASNPIEPGTTVNLPVSIIGKLTCLADGRYIALSSDGEVVVILSDWTTVKSLGKLPGFNPAAFSFVNDFKHKVDVFGQDLRFAAAVDDRSIAIGSLSDVASASIVEVDYGHISGFAVSPREDYLLLSIVVGTRGNWVYRYELVDLKSRRILREWSERFDAENELQRFSPDIALFSSDGRSLELIDYVHPGSFASENQETVSYSLSLPTADELTKIACQVFKEELIFPTAQDKEKYAGITDVFGFSPGC